jgi:hypothetical protein
VLSVVAAAVVVVTITARQNDRTESVALSLKGEESLAKNQRCSAPETSLLVLVCLGASVLMMVVRYCCWHGPDYSRQDMVISGWNTHCPITDAWPINILPDQ